MLKQGILSSLGPIAGWSLFVWVTRIRNIWTDDEFSLGGQLIRFGIAAAFVIGGVFLVALMIRARSRDLSGPERRLVATFAMGTMIYWVVRGAQILAADHDAAFKAVHTVLGVVSIVVAVRALQFVKRGHETRLITV